MNSFSAQVEAFVRKAKVKMDEKARRVSYQLMTDVKNITPVDTGALKQSWTMGINSFPSTFDGKILPVKAGDVVYIATDKVYAPIIEYGLYPNPPKKPTGRTINGYSTQAPQGMVHVTVMNMKNKISDGGI